MAGKRLATAGVLVAAIATAALWVVPHGSLAAQLRTMPLRAMRHAQSAVTTGPIAQLPASVALPAPQSATWTPVLGLTVTGGALFALALIGVARQQRGGTVPVTARTTHRGRAPPSLRPHHAARTRNH